MKGRRVAFVLGAFLGTLATQDLVAGDNDRAVPRGGGGGGSHDSGASSRHPGSSGGGSHSGGSNSGGSYSGSSHSGGESYSGGSSSGSSREPRTAAQRRQPVPGQGHFGHGHGGSYGRGYYGGSYYYPYSYWPYWGWSYGYYSPWYFPYDGFYAGFGYPYYGGGGYFGGSHWGRGGYPGGRSYESAGAVRLIVEPVQTKVYVDEYYAGKVDDFDGMFQRLNLRPGAHDITLKLDGYETHKVKLYVSADRTLKVRHDMVRGDSGRVSEQTVGDPADAERYARREREYERMEGEDRDEPEARTEERERRGDDRWSQARERGTLRLDVTPSDASIYVDGMFRGTGQDLRRLNLSPGRHRLEVVRPGYRTLERDVEVQSGETEQIDVDLPRS